VKEETGHIDSFIWMIVALVLMSLLLVCCFWALFAYARVEKRRKETERAKMKSAKTTEDEIGLKTNFQSVESHSAFINYNGNRVLPMFTKG
jgi:hypothetical protein